MFLFLQLLFCVVFVCFCQWQTKQQFFTVLLRLFSFSFKWKCWMQSAYSRFCSSYASTIAMHQYFASAIQLFMSLQIYLIYVEIFIFSFIRFLLVDLLLFLLLQRLVIMGLYTHYTYMPCFWNGTKEKYNYNKITWNMVGNNNNQLSCNSNTNWWRTEKK